MAASKPLGIKNYGRIAHLPGSRIGPGDHKCRAGQSRIATEKARDKHDHILAQVEGAIWRVERNELVRPNAGARRLQVDFVVKYVRPDKAAGCYLPEVSGQPAICHWRMEKPTHD
jgi:hypothetical protein